MYYAYKSRKYPGCDWEQLTKTDFKSKKIDKLEDILTRFEKKYCEEIMEVNDNYVIGKIIDNKFIRVCKISFEKDKLINN